MEASSYASLFGTLLGSILIKVFGIPNQFSLPMVLQGLIFTFISMA